MVQLGQFPPARHVIAHISDTHLLGGGRRLYGTVDTDPPLVHALELLGRSNLPIEALVFTGDLADLAEPDAYARLKSIVEPAAEKIGAQIVWVMGNHDERPAYSKGLFDHESTEPQDRVEMIGGLRIISLDSTVPGHHHGDLLDTQLEWLRQVLAEPAADGTLLALHHPPLPSPVEIMAILELQGMHRLADVIRGTDVCGILAGHLHHAMSGMFAGIPVSVAAATCYTIDPSAPVGSLLGVDGAQSINLVHVYDDQILHSVVPVNETRAVSGFPDSVLERLAQLTHEERIAAFSNKRSTFNLAEVESSGAPEVEHTLE
ncbi:phosphodiesterase [Pseudolysinimonas yzui]|uniref:3',5'-cyclic adenosine monophosphate phosphodiesterase CpdA n=1 Tax=Pseudolysinimonas yzui TaxID=2708254 RepID=A0A8J3LZR3_9MICO|nr:phosphodiesterase [Pseudolysinimonas yzui]GHF06183.1 3',5'-cyclic adenosine monophosphate phosphodiesterase CpdA [Pseudolysinimonas yzui]